MRQNARAFAGALERADDMQQIGVIALFAGGRAKGLKSLVGVIERFKAGAPAFVGKWRICDDIVEGFVQDHVHTRQAAGGGVLFLPVEGDLGAGFITHLQQQRAGAAGRVINGGGVGGLCVANANNLRHYAADLSGGIELALALAALRGEVPHQVFVGVTQDVVTLGAVLGKIECFVLEDGDEVGKPVHHFLAAAELGGVVEVRQVGQLIGIGQRRDNLLVDLVADVWLALERDHVLEAGARWDSDRRILHAGVFVADVFDEEQDENVVLVLAGIHATAKFIAACP